MELNTDWIKISETPGLTEQFIEENIDKINWPSICWYQKLSIPFIIKHSDKFTAPDGVCWRALSCTHNLTDELIEQYSKYIDWIRISYSKKLSEQFMEKHQDKIDWMIISWRQNLSEDFVDKHSNKVYWPYIFENQKLSSKFQQKYKNKPGYPKYGKIFTKIITWFKMFCQK